jgi:hypothetical protein
VNSSRFRLLLGRLSSRPTVAYVVVSGEDDARRAVSLLDVLDVPVMTHVMDLDRDELAPENMPSLGELLRRSHRIFALNALIAEQLRRFDPSHLEILHFSSAPIIEQSIERDDLLVLSGSWGPHAVNRNAPMLAEALARLRQRRPTLRAIYFGAQSHRIPPTLVPFLEDRGFLTDAACASLLARARIAVLMTPDGGSSWDRYSIPSRIADYLANGLPIIAAITGDNATCDLLNDRNLSKAVQLVDNATTLVDRAESWLDDTASWCAASESARAFASATFCCSSIRSRIHEALQATVRTAP